MDNLTRWWPVVAQLLLVVFLAGVLWVRVATLEELVKDDKHPVSEAEYAVLANEIDHVKETVDRVEDNQEKQDEKLDDILKAVK